MRISYLAGQPLTQQQWDRFCYRIAASNGVHSCVLTHWGSLLQGVKFDLQLPPASKLISQPPADSHLGDAAMFHYTWWVHRTVMYSSGQSCGTRAGAFSCDW